METFRWNKYFDTGLGEVDQQHKVLVNLINRLNESLIRRGEVSTQEVEAVFKELVEYTQYHFREEEAMMLREGLDTRFVDKHIRLHIDFLRQAIEMHDVILDRDHGSAKSMLDFLVHWLAFHILGIDRSMSRQVAAIRAGQTPASAFEGEEHINTVVTEPLLSALDGLFQQVSEQNRDLLELNQTLESKVAERTHNLDVANQRLVAMAMTDALTGLPNRRHAMTRLAQEWEEAVRGDTPLSCMMIDADGFKGINDNCGHDAGDVVLRELARQLGFAMRSDDIVCRLGGDEFFIICPNTSLDGALHIAEIMRASVAEMRVPAGSTFWVGSVSVGVATRTSAMQEIEDLMKVADEGLYQAKRAGRNRVACAMAAA